METENINDNSTIISLFNKYVNDKSPIYSMSVNIESINFNLYLSQYKDLLTFSTQMAIGSVSSKYRSLRPKVGIKGRENISFLDNTV